VHATPQENSPSTNQPANQDAIQDVSQDVVLGSDLSSQPNQGGHVRLFGRIGRYFEVKHTHSGLLRATFTLATHRSLNDGSGNWVKQTVWQRIVAWGDTARSVGELIQKGARVSVEGKFKTREWTDKDDNLRTTTELVARNVRFLDVAHV